MSPATLRAETLTVLNEMVGSTPARLGYNLGHFMPGSNAADWFRYSGVDAARLFISVSDIEPTDDLAPVGDGVSNESGFFLRRAMLRANGASTTGQLNTGYVNWTLFEAKYRNTASGNNRLQLDYALRSLRDLHVSVLANITASPSRFPITDNEDWPGKWELWQHYYAQAFILSRDYGVQSFSMFNEPNGWAGLTETGWMMRYLICSDAIQAAVSDAGVRSGKPLQATVFAPNTANGAEKYNTAGADEASTDTWGRDAVTNRHRRLDGTMSADWMNLHVYNYQKYTTRTHPGGGFSGYVTDFQTLRNYIDTDQPGETPLPMALTEFNVRTGANYDLTTATQDSMTDCAALGANCIALTEQGVHQLYLFKFGQTASNSTYGVAKNGTHYVENGSNVDNNYGGATRCAEVYRLFTKAARGGRARFKILSTSGASPTPTAGVWSLATFDPGQGSYSLFIANKETTAIPLEVIFALPGLIDGQPVLVEEVSAGIRGGGVRLAALTSGRLPSALLPPQSVWLITLPSSRVTLSSAPASADTQLGDGAWRAVAGGTTALMSVKADGMADGRRVSVIRMPVPAGPIPRWHTVLLELDAATASGTTPVQAHVYGTRWNDWQESALNWTLAAPVLRQDAGNGNLIRNNVITRDGQAAMILGQLTVDSPSFIKRWIDVTSFVKSSPDGFISFVIAQDHRWDVAQPQLTVGDTQTSGLVIASRESAGGGPRIVTWTRPPPWIRWREAQFPGASSDESVSGALADPDRDGVVNLLEYALGGEALTHRADFLPTAGLTDSVLEFHCSRNQGQDDLRRTIQVASSPDGPWTVAAESLGEAPFTSARPGVSLSETGDDIANLKVTFREIQPPGSSRKFLRMKVELLGF